MGLSAAEDQAHWYVVQTQAGKERLAEGQLRNQNFETFCPTRQRMRRIGKRMCATLDPFFPNYLFVRLDIARQRWRSVNGTIGVAHLVGFGSGSEARPAPLPRGLVEHFQALSTPEGEMRFDEALSPGDRVRIVGGPFHALCGILEKGDAKHRVSILLDILSGTRRVDVARDCLVRI